MKKIGLFGGTFDPPHFGHIHIALSVLEKLSLDQVAWIPSVVNPLKQDKPPLPFPHRYQMVLRAVEGIDHFVVDPIESFREPPSYTIDTVRALKKSSGEETEFYLILANDHLESLDQWKDIEELLDTVTPVVGSREATSPKIDKLKIDQKYKDLLNKSVLQTPVFQVSSTDIRGRLSEGLYCGHLAPRSTLDYIKANRLYY